MAAKSASAILADPAVQARRAAIRQPMGGGGMAKPMEMGMGMGMPGSMGMSRMAPMTTAPMTTAPMTTAPGAAGRVPGGGNMLGGGGGAGGGVGGAPQGGPQAVSRQAPAPAPPPDRGGPYGGGYDEYGQPLDVKGKRKFKHAGALKRLNRKGFPWMQDQGMYQTAMSTIQDILDRKGQMSPERMIQEQAAIEQGRGQGQQALAARLGQYGVDPSSPQAMAMMGGVDQAANRMQAENRRALDLQAEQQMRNDLNLPIPWLQAMLSMMTKKGGGGVQALPQATGGGAGPDYAGALAKLGSAAINKWG